LLSQSDNKQSPCIFFGQIRFEATALLRRPQNGDPLVSHGPELVAGLSKFCPWGRDIFRIKGVLNVDAEDRRFVFQGVHMLLDGRPGRPWQFGESRRNEIVFIGRDLEEQKLREGFRECLV
jgi:G3E family GTPase